MEKYFGTNRTLTFAGTDTTSSALARILQLLCIHPEVQDQLREEIVSAQRTYGGRDIGYDELVSLPYLDAACRETLRLYVHRRLFSVTKLTHTRYPPAPFGTRE